MTEFPKDVFRYTNNDGFKVSVEPFLRMDYVEPLNGLFVWIGMPNGFTFMMAKANGDEDIKGANFFGDLFYDGFTEIKVINSKDIGIDAAVVKDEEVLGLLKRVEALPSGDVESLPFELMGGRWT